MTPFFYNHKRNIHFEMNFNRIDLISCKFTLDNCGPRIDFIYCAEIALPFFADLFHFLHKRIRFGWLGSFIIEKHIQWQLFVFGVWFLSGVKLASLVVKLQIDMFNCIMKWKLWYIPGAAVARKRSQICDILYSVPIIWWVFFKNCK